LAFFVFSAACLDAAAAFASAGRRLRFTLHLTTKHFIDGSVARDSVATTPHAL